MHRTTKLVTALGALAIVVAACGGGASPTPAASAPAASTPAESVAPSEAAYPTADIKLLYWTKEGADSLTFVEAQAAAYTALHPNVTFEVVNKDVEVLREDFQTASLAGEGPDILGTVADHVGVFTSADLIQPLDDIVDKASYVPAAAEIVTADGKLWGAPISFGNQLMLYWNKSMAGDTAPADSDAWVAKAKELTTADKVGITFNQTESFWLVPFLGGYGGSVFAEDGKTPTLNTDAMKSALQFLYDLKFTDKVTPAEADYNVADAEFKDGKAAYIINGDWAMSAYAAAPDAETPGLGDKLAVGPPPAAHRRRLAGPVHRGHVLHGPEGRCRGRRPAVRRQRLHQLGHGTGAVRLDGQDPQAPPRQRRRVRRPDRHRRPAPQGRGRCSREGRAAADEPGDALRVRLDDRGRP